MHATTGKLRYKPEPPPGFKIRRGDVLVAWPPVPPVDWQKGLARS
jgi:hypothetical protein